jgi:hypothetical protein
MAGIRGNAALLTALASGQSVKSAARAAGVSERTAFRRVADPVFRQAVSQARAELLARAVGLLADSASTWCKTPSGGAARRSGRRLPRSGAAIPGVGRRVITDPPWRGRWSPDLR